jgi:hypothetical protein
MQANGSVGGKIGWDHSSQVIKINAVDSFASTHLVVDVNGKVGIGTDSPGQGQSTPISDVKFDVLGNQMLSDLSTTNTDQSKLFFFRSDGAVASQGVVPDGLKIGAIEWAALTSGDNNNSISSARIEVEASNTWSSAAVRNADIIFSTVGANALTEKLRITSDNKISGSSTSTGSFGALEIPGNLKVDSASQIFASTGAGSNNTIFGRNAATSFGANNGTNIIVGPNAADAMDGGESHNIAIGNHSMGDADEGASGTIDFNVAIGNSTLGGGAFSGTDQLYGNIAIGYQALTSTGTNGSTGQIGIGFQALEKVTTGPGNIAIGYNAGKLLTTGQYNLAIGHEALTTATELDDNLAIGKGALRYASGSAGKGRNMAIGYLAGGAITSGEFNVMIGRSANGQATTAGSNTVMGYFAGYNTRSGSSNVMVGTQAGYSYQNGDGYNTYLGAFSGYHNRTGYANTYLGGNAGYGVSGNSHSGNTGIGYQALKAITTGGSNSTLGFGSGDALTTGHNNVAIGISAIGVSTNVGYAVALGDTALGAGNATDAADDPIATVPSAASVALPAPSAVSPSATA